MRLLSATIRSHLEEKSNSRRGQELLPDIYKSQISTLPSPKESTHGLKTFVLLPDFPEVFATLTLPDPQKLRDSAVEFHLIELVIFRDVIMQQDKGRN